MKKSARVMGLCLTLLALTMFAAGCFDTSILTGPSTDTNTNTNTNEQHQNPPPTTAPTPEPSPSPTPSPTV